MQITQNEADRVCHAARVAAMDRGLAEPIDVRRVGKGIETLVGTVYPGYYASGVYGPDHTSFSMVFPGDSLSRAIIAS